MTLGAIWRARLSRAYLSVS